MGFLPLLGESTSPTRLSPCPLPFQGRQKQGQLFCQNHPLTPSPTPKPPLKGEVSALADGEVSSGAKNSVGKGIGRIIVSPMGFLPLLGESTSPTRLPPCPLPFQGRQKQGQLFRQNHPLTPKPPLNSRS